MKKTKVKTKVKKGKNVRIRNEKAITLIALIVTIIVLLILAGVTIATLTGENGILTRANDAKEKTEEASEKENTILSQYDTIIKQETGEAWKQNKTIVSKGDTVLEVGDYVDYQSGVAGYQDENGWRVLGAEDGKLLLLSTYLVTDNYTLSGAEDYLNDTGVKKLNAECEKYGNGLYATGARSVKAEDIDRITGYNPEKTGNGEIYEKGQIDEYGNEVTYKIENGYVTYSSKNGNGTSEYTSFTMPDGRVLGKDINEVTLKTNAYYYWPTTLTNNWKDEEVGLTDTSKAYNMLFTDPTDESSYIGYWLANSYIETRTTGVVWGIYGVPGGFNKGNIGLYRSYDGDRTASYGIRAVVSIEDYVVLNGNGENRWMLTK